MDLYISVTLRVVATIIHLAQAVISFTAGLYFSGIVGAMLLGAQLYAPKTFKDLFKVRTWIVSVIGSIIWLFIAVAEI